jgi:hypothetical protein
MRPGTDRPGATPASSASPSPGAGVAPASQLDRREAQVARIDQFLDSHPWATLKEVDAACDAGSVSKVISHMRKVLGYVLAVGRREVLCADGHKVRRVRTYALVSRPTGAQPDLFEDQ